MITGCVVVALVVEQQLSRVVEVSTRNGTLDLVFARHMAGAERYRRDAACLLVSVQQFLLCKAALQLPDADREHQGAEQCDDDDRPPRGPAFPACHVAPVRPVRAALAAAGRSED